MTSLARAPAWLVLGGCYAAAALVSFLSDDLEETVVAVAALAVLIVYWRARRDQLGSRAFWVLVFPLPVLVLFHERPALIDDSLKVQHWVAYLIGLVSLGMAWKLDRRP